MGGGGGGVNRGESFECARRLALTGALVFIRQGSQTQIALGCLICIAAALVFALQWPYATFRDNALGIMSHCQLTGTLFSAMMYKLGKNAELAYDREATGWLLIALNGTVFLIMLGWVAFEVLVDEGPSLRSRERQFLAQASFLLSGGSVRGRFMADGATVEEHHEEKRRKSTMPVQMSTLTVGSGGTGDGEIGLRSQESVEVELTDMYGRGSSGSSVAYTDNPMQGGAGGRGEAAKPAPKLSPGSGVSSRRNLMGRLKLAGSTASLKSGSRRGLFGGASSARSLADVKERGSSSGEKGVFWGCFIEGSKQAVLAIKGRLSATVLIPAPPPSERFPDSLLVVAGLEGPLCGGSSLRPGQPREEERGRRARRLEQGVRRRQPKLLLLELGDGGDGVGGAEGVGVLYRLS